MTSTGAPDKTFFYFGYGSNMSIDRLTKRLKEPHETTAGIFKKAGVVESGGFWMGKRYVGKLENWQMTFSMPSDAWTNCGACIIEQKDGEVVYGSLDEIDERAFEVLDVFEAVATSHYRRQVVNVFCQQLDKQVEAIAYVPACKIDHSLKPSKQYLAHVLGCKQIPGFPAEYIKKLEETEAIDLEADPNHIRK